MSTVVQQSWFHISKVAIRNLYFETDVFLSWEIDEGNFMFPIEFLGTVDVADISISSVDVT